MISRSAIVVLALAGSAIVLGATPRQSTDAGARQDGLVAVGLACGDGNFIPLAARSKGAWHPLTEPEDGLAYFYSVLTPQALRLPRQGWTLYGSRSASPRALSLRSARPRDGGASSDCLSIQSFESDGPRALGRVAFPDGTRELSPLLGIGVLGPARFERGDDVTQQPDENSRRVAATIVRKVHAVERRLDRKAGSSSPLRRFEGRKDVRSVVRLLTMVRHRAGDRDWYFFQAHKRYGEWYVFEGKRMYKDWASTLVHGWLRVSPAAVSVVSATGLLEDDDGKGSSYYKPAGFLALEDRTVLIVEGSGYEIQWYELFEFGPGDTPPRSVVRVDVGGS